MISSQYTSKELLQFCTEYPTWILNFFKSNSESGNQHFSSCFCLEKLFNNPKFQSKDINGVINISAIPDQDNPLQLMNPQNHVSI